MLDPTVSGYSASPSGVRCEAFLRFPAQPGVRRTTVRWQASDDPVRRAIQVEHRVFVVQIAVTGEAERERGVDLRLCGEHVQQLREVVGLFALVPLQRLLQTARTCGPVDHGPAGPAL